MRKNKIKSVLLIAMMVFMGNIAFSQVKLLPKIGLNVSGLDGGNENSNAEGRIGWHIGADFRVGESALYFRPGVYYQSFTARLVGEDENNVEFKDETKINFLKVPMNLGLRLTKPGGFLEVHLHGGIVPNLLLNVDEKSNFSFNKESLKSFNLGSNLGVDLDLSIITINMQYEWGLTKFFEASNQKNNIFSIGAGVRI